MPEDKIREVFSQNLTRQLNLHGKTQKDLVNFIKVSSSTVSNWCTGQKLPRMDKIQSIAKWLNISTSELLENKTEESFSDTEKFPPDIRAAARGMMNLSPDDKEIAISMINLLSKKGKEAKNENS